jgi:hypothetical protein
MMADLYEYYNSQPALSDDSTRNYILLNQQRIMENHGRTDAYNQSVVTLTDLFEDTVQLSTKDLERIKSLEDEVELLMIFEIILGIGVVILLVSIVVLYCMRSTNSTEAVEGDEEESLFKPPNARFEIGSRKQTASAFYI